MIDRARHDEYLLTKIKLPAAANHAIYLVIFHWVVGSLYLIEYIHFTVSPIRRVFKRGEITVLLLVYARNFFLN